jgi:transcription antitermination factor NusG
LLRRPRAFGQLSKYAGLADQLEQHITTAKNKPQKPKLFGNLEFGNDTQEAFNVFEAEHKLMQMEAEIKHEFIYGAFADLEGGYGSLDGYRKFLEMRRKITGRPHPHEARATRYAKEVFGRHASLWWQFNRRGGWVPASVHGN